MRRSPALLAVALSVAFGHSVAAETRDGDGFRLEVVAPTAAKAGAPATATIVVRPRGSAHLNTEYPFKVELVARAGAKVGKSLLRKEDARTFSATGGELDVAITVDKAGAGLVDGTIRFATCDGESCAVHKESFTIATTAR